MSRRLQKFFISATEASGVTLVWAIPEGELEVMDPGPDSKVKARVRYLDLSRFTSPAAGSHHRVILDKLTMVHAWDTFYPSRIEEIPMLEETGGHYPNLIVEGSLPDYLNENIITFSTTCFVVGNGQVGGEVIVGEKRRTVYKSILNQRLVRLNQ